MSTSPLRSSIAALVLAPLALASIAIGQMIPGGVGVTPGGGTPLPPPAPAAAKAPYALLDRVQGPYTNLGDIVPFRPMAIPADGSALYAVNTHGNTVQVFDDLSGQPAHTWPVAWGPVSIALYDSPLQSRALLLVVCRGSHVLCLVDRLDGTLVDVIDLPFEPADIVVVPDTDRAFVSCSGVDRVVEVSIDAGRVARSFAIPAKHPAYLSLDADGDVLVAPMISGNNSLMVGQLDNGVIVDMANPALSSTGMPDNDLFRIRRATGAVEPLARHTGTILFAQGVSPADGRLWQLNWEAKNKDPLKQSEPAIRGDFVDNRLTIVTLPATPGGVATSHQVINLDDTDRSTPAVEFDPARTVGQPCGLEFARNGFAFVTGMATDNVTLLGPSGNFVVEWNVPDGSIPRASLMHPNGIWLFVYCWGTNKVETYSFAPFVGTSFLTLDLGHDPAPEIVKQGRAVFYDATFSQHNNATCGSCHVDGRADGLAWNLSNKPYDDKGPLVTQTLAGIERLAPFHWRGERSTLAEFNGAFTGLLGAPAMLDTTPGGEFDRFQAFVFSLQNTANPGQGPQRVLDDALAPVEASGFKGSAVAGQQKYIELDSVGTLSCSDCHSLPTGSNNDRIFEIGSQIAQQTHQETTAFNEMWRKEQPIVQVDVLGNTLNVPLNGFGLLHNGSIDNLFGFVNRFGHPDQDIADITAFIRQFDDGQAPAIHEAIGLDQQHASNVRRIESLLVKQAKSDNISLAARGQLRLGNSWRTLTFAYEPRAEHFVCEDSTVAPKTLAQFSALAQADQAHLVFVGLPLGNAATWIDDDQDGAKNLDEVARGSNRRDPDTDDDTFLDGTELRLGSHPNLASSTPVDTRDPAVSNFAVDWNTTRVASLTFETDEPTNWSLAYTDSASGVTRTVASRQLATAHLIRLKELLPSTDAIPPGYPGLFVSYTGTLTVTDDAGRATSVAMPTFTTDGLIFALNPPIAVTNALAFTNVQHLPGGQLRIQGTLRTALKLGGPPPIDARNFVAIANVVVNDTLWSNFTNHGGAATSFKLFGTSYTAMPGPFVLLSPTDATGSTTFDVTIQGLAPGAKVVLNTIAACLVDPLTYDATDPDFGSATNPLPMGNWSFSDTKPEFRSLTTTY